MALVDWLRRKARLHADRPAVSIAGSATERLTYDELWSRADTMASQLLAAGLRRGEMVCFQARKSPALLSSLLGVLLAGGAFVVVHDKARWPQLRYVQRITNARFFFIDGSCLTQLDLEFERHTVLRKPWCPVCSAVDGSTA